MPELPEVETMVRDLTQRVVGRTITGANVALPRSIVWPGVVEFQDRVTGQRIETITRRGKYAIFALASGDALIIHRGMSGSLLLCSPQDPLESHVRLTLRLDDGSELRFNDPRTFGKVFIMNAAGAERPLPWTGMGPEPLAGDFTVAALQERLRGRKALLKPLLLNQQIVAGLGNIYVDEALFRAQLHPQRRAHTLTEPEIARLHAAIGEVLRAAVDGRGTTFSNYTDINGRRGAYQSALQVYHRAGEPCPRCGTPIERSVVGGRGTHFCPHCQKA